MLCEYLSPMSWLELDLLSKMISNFIFPQLLRRITRGIEMYILGQMVNIEVTDQFQNGFK